MIAGDFLATVLPTRGEYALMVRNGDAKPSHQWYRTIADMAGAVERMDAKRTTVYHACASFVEKGRRTGDNALLARSFWLDLDVGDGPAKFTSKGEAAKALKAFLAATSLPMPTYIVDSGGGLHVYWCLRNDLPAVTWREYAQRLKALTAHHRFNADPSRTADIASVLRPVGSHNYKYPSHPEVRDIVSSVVYDESTFLAPLVLAATSIPAATRAAAVPKPVGINDAFMAKPDFQPADAAAVAAHCPQMARMRDTRGNLPEPLWYGGLQVLKFCAYGEDIAHEWSEGHPDYDPDEVDDRLARVAGMGPTTCKTFAERDPNGLCSGCQYAGKITSPAQLGRMPANVAPIAPTIAADGEEDITIGDLPAAPNMPHGFEVRGQAIVFVSQKGEEAPQVRTVSYFEVHAYELSYDIVQRCEMMRLRCYFPATGWNIITMPTSKLASPKDLESELRRGHVKVGDAMLMRKYLSEQIAILDRSAPRRNYYSSFGWKDGTNQFVLGHKVYMIDGSVHDAALAPEIDDLATAMHPRGELSDWVSATSVLAQPGMEAHAFTFGVSLGAPLMRLTGFECVLMSAHGRTNSGKTSMARFGLSAWGRFDTLKMKQQDTENAKIQRLSQLASLPGYVDEITNEDPQKMSSLVYDITQGRSKMRLRQDGSQRATLEWSTLALSSSNTSVHGKLALAKINAEAERLRVFEYALERSKGFTREAAEMVHTVSSTCTGLVGPVFMAHVVVNQESVIGMIQAFSAQLRDKANARDEERYWIAGVACVLTALTIANKLGLCHVALPPVVRWAVRMLHELRSEVDEAATTPWDALGLFIDEHSTHRLTVTELPMRKGATPEYQVDRYPTKDLRMRYEATTARMFISTYHYRRWLSERGEMPSTHERALIEQGILVRKIKRSLGAHTAHRGIGVVCYEFNLGTRETEGLMQIIAAKDAGHEQRRIESA